TDEQWDNTDTWWQKFHKGKDDNGDAWAGSEIEKTEHFAIVIGLLNLDTEHRGKPELHPVYAMFLLLNRNWKLRQSTWAFFVRNWGNQGSCGWHSPNLTQVLIKVQIPRAVGIVSSNTWEGSRKTRDFSSMDFSAQPHDDGMELRFVLLKQESESWMMGDITFQDVRPGTLDDPDERTHAPFKALLAQIYKLPESSRKELFAQLESVVLRNEGRRRSVRMIAQPTTLGAKRLQSPLAVVPKTDLVRLETDSLGELNRRKQFEVLRKFFA